MEGSISIGALAKRSGVPASTLRFYDAQGLIRAERSAGNTRRFPRSTLRRIAFIRAAQAIGLSLDKVRETLSRLPDSRTPTRADWEMLSAEWQPLIEKRIATLIDLRDALTRCIGCGCLSIDACVLANPGDRLADQGAGARLVALKV